MKALCHVVCICCGQGFPNGMAQTARIRMVGKALVAGGCRFTVLNIGGGLCPNSVSSGSVDGIRFAYLPGHTERPSSPLLRWASHGQGVLQVAKRLYALRRVERDLCIYSWFPGGKYALFHRYLQSIHCPVVKEENEWFPWESTSLRDRYMRLTQGSLVISHPIIDRLKKLPSYSPTHRILYVPILVDPDEWMPLGQVADTPRGDSPYVLWCGNLSEATKDIEFLIRVMKTVNDVEMCRLLLVGNHNESVRSSIYNLAGNIGLKERSLCLTGFVSDDELRKLMNGAEALLMPLWETERSVCRFPTKLGLYLSSATPVVATAIGELTRYLEDVKSAYLAPPNTINGFAERIIALIRDPKRAKSIGLAGQQVARRHFSIQAHQDQLVEFFSDLARNNGKCRG